MSYNPKVILGRKKMSNNDANNVSRYAKQKGIGYWDAMKELGRMPVVKNEPTETEQLELKAIVDGVKNN